MSRLAVLLLAIAGSLTPAVFAAEAQVPSAAELDALEAKIVRAEDVEAIKRLTFVFGYYRDKFFYDEALALFTEDAVIDYAGGKYLGKPSIRRLLGTSRYTLPEAIGKRGPQSGLMNDHILMEQVITVSPDGRTANARFKDWNTQGVFGKSQTRSSGVYENEYRKMDGVWKISAMAYCTRYANPYLVNPRDIPAPNDSPATPEFYPRDRNGPDRQSNYACHEWPHPGVSPPLHYPHPVTGDYIHRP
jgi:SnoaL-like domain